MELIKIVDEDQVWEVSTNRHIGYISVVEPDKDMGIVDRIKSFTTKDTWVGSRLLREIADYLDSL